MVRLLMWQQLLRQHACVQQAVKSSHNLTLAQLFLTGWPPECCKGRQLSVKSHLLPDLGKVAG
jgi:hypothetical protein